MPADLAAAPNGQAAVMYTGPTLWHRLGKRLDAPATAAEAITAAGLDYTVELQSLKTETDLRVPRRKAVIRTDTRAVLGVVSRGYSPIQNRQCFSFLDGVIADAGLRYETAGALGKGERIWLLAKLPSHIRVRGSDDEVQKFLLLSNSHDGSSALRCFFTGIRVVCANTLNAALREGAAEGIAIRHRGNLAAKVQEARDALGLAQRFFDDLEGQIDRLAMHIPTQAQLASYFKVLFPDPEERQATRAENVRSRLTELFESGMGQDIPQIRHTSWAAFNAVSEYVDHHKPTRGRDDADRARSGWSRPCSAPGRTSRRGRSTWPSGWPTGRSSPTWRLDARRIGQRRGVCMSLKVNVGVSRKLTENYNSTGYSLNLEGEIHAPIEDPEAVIERVKEFYDLAEEALRQQLEHRRPDESGPVLDRAPSPTPPPERPAAPPPTTTTPRQPPAGNNHQPRQGGDAASPKQVKFIENLAKRHRLSTVQLETVINETLGRACTLDQLTKRDGGAVIDALNNTADNGNGR